jgi:hypothetical protein
MILFGNARLGHPSAFLGRFRLAYVFGCFRLYLAFSRRIPLLRGRFDNGRKLLPHGPLRGFWDHDLFLLEFLKNIIALGSAGGMVWG